MFDHFDSEVSCEEYYCDDFDTWANEVDEIPDEELECVADFLDNYPLQHLTDPESVV